MHRFLNWSSLTVSLLSALAASMLPKPEGGEMLFIVVSVSAGLTGYWLGSSPAVAGARPKWRLIFCIVAVLLVPVLAMHYYNFVEYAGPGGIREYLAWVAMAAVFAFVTCLLRVAYDAVGPSRG